MKFPKINIETRTALIYLLFGGLWILLSDQLLAYLIQDSANLTQFQTYKGWLFVGLSAALIYFLLKRNLSAQRRVEKELRETNERYRLLFDTSLDAVLLTSPNGRIFDANPAASRMFGRTEAEICQVGRSGVIDLKDPRLLSALDERTRTGKFIGEMNFLRKDGTPFPCEVTSALFTDSQGQTRTSMIIRDISERKQIEEQLRKSEERLRFALEGANDGLWDVQIQTGDVYISPRGCEILGYRIDEMLEVTKRWNDLIHPEDLAHMQALMAAYLDGKAPVFEVEQRLRTKSNGWKWVLTRGKVVEKNAAGKPARITGMYTDISERKQVEEALREHKAMLDFAHVLVRDLDSRIIYWNRGAEELYGWTNDEATGVVSHTLLNTQFPDSLESMQDQLLRDGHWEGELIHTRHDGTRVTVASHQVLYRDAKGRPIRILEVNNDITELKITQEKLSASLEELRRVTVRLADLEENERRSLVKELHDQVGQSLTALSINLSLIRNRIGHEAPEALAARFDSPLELVNEITDKIRSIMAELHPPVLDDYGLAAALKWFGDRLQKQTGLQVQVVGDITHLKHAYSVEMSFFRIAQEALNNVVKYAESSQAFIHLKETPDSILMTISDEGAGFDPVEAAQSGNAHWGLLTMRERAEAAGGKLNIESFPGEGTKISVRIPR